METIVVSRQRLPQMSAIGMRSAGEYPAPCYLQKTTRVRDETLAYPKNATAVPGSLATILAQMCMSSSSSGAFGSSSRSFAAFGKLIYASYEYVRPHTAQGANDGSCSPCVTNIFEPFSERVSHRRAYNVRSLFAVDYVYVNKHQVCCTGCHGTSVFTWSIVRYKYTELCRTVGFCEREIRTAGALCLRTKKTPKNALCRTAPYKNQSESATNPARLRHDIRVYRYFVANRSSWRRRCTVPRVK